MIKVALFDLDGTLFDTEPQYTVFWGSVARKYRPDIPRLEHIIKGTTLTQIYDRYFNDPQWQKEITAELNEYERNMTYEFVPGAVELLHDLKRNGVKCAVVTSSNKPKMDSVRLQIPDFDEYFDKVLTSEMFTASKPAPDCYLLGASAFNAKPDECVVFEDAFNGLEAGMSAGMFTFGLATNLSPDAIKDKCSYVLKNFETLTYEKLVALIGQQKQQ